MIATFPLQWKHGQTLFFCAALKPEVITHVCRVKYRQKDRVLVRVLNATHNMVFDPRSGIALPFGTKLRVCWLGDERYGNMEYETAIAAAQKEYKEFLWSQRKS